MCLRSLIGRFSLGFEMVILALLQSEWFGRLRQKFAPGSWCRRMSVSSVVWVVGSVTLRFLLNWFIVALLQSVWWGPPYCPKAR